MISKNELDREGYIRSKSLEDMKKNEYLIKNDKVKIPESIDYYLITDEVNEIILDNGLYAKKILVGDINLKTNKKTYLEAINELTENNSGNIDLSNYQTKTDENLNTTNKEIVGSINELKTNIDNKLDLSNGGTINGQLTVTGDILSNGNITAYSDKRLKENIYYIENSLEKVKQLKGVTYNLIGDNKKQIGLIAQDVEKIIPEVIYKDKNGFLSIDYSRLISILINAINELIYKVGE